MPATARRTPRRIPAALLSDEGATLGEGPVWDAAAERVLWVDIRAGRVLATRLDGSTETILRVEPPLGAVALRASGGLILVSGNAVRTWCEGDAGTSVLADVPMGPGERWNDAKVDPRGRLIAGTLTETYPEGHTKVYPPGGSRLLRVDADGSVVKLMDVTLSNGLGWSPDGRTLYYVDTQTSRLDAYRYDAHSGSISSRRIVADIPASDGWPDGLAIDEEGGIWLALWGGGCVRRYLPDGTLDAVIELPAGHVTSCAFVGANLERLFITTARDELTAAQLAGEPHAGSVFMADPGVRGLAIPSFRG